ncbi:MAG: beta-galactosidase trimerization domain-containing protein [Prolixibacteraceae bacterium]|jgi:hypothetical protein|nr:beta-galactosidase trimerization domain-containing protein [Prolixibacteraceae bacterium]
MSNKISPKLLSHILPLIVGIILLLFVASAQSQTPVSKRVSLKEGNAITRPAWISQEPLIFVGNWDSEFIFRHRRGGDPLWQQGDYEKQHTVETVKKLKEMGVTMAIIHFYKAFGLEAEKEYIEDAKKLAAICKQNGLRVGVYVGSTMGYETFLLEKPEARKWIVPDYMGLPVVYGDQTFRKRVYFQHPGYKAYMKKVVRIAIEDLKADLIHFDNSSNQGLAPVFFHPLAIKNFRTYLKNKYTPEMLKKRFGFSNVKYVEPPKINQSLSTINDPLFQEWTDFRCQQVADYYGEMGEYIRKLNPEVAVECNPHGLSGKNTMWEESVDFPRILVHTDFFWTEGEETSLADDGVLISKIRTFKMAQTLDNRVFTYANSSKLEMAEAMAYNRQGMGMVGGLSAGDEVPEDRKGYIKFFHKNFDYYRNIHNVADVAVLHSFASMAYNSDQPYQSTFLYEQALIQGKIPFDIIFDGNLENLSKYKVLVLADQECLSDDKLDLIRNFVNQGGGLVATGNTSLYNEYRQRKREIGLSDLYKVNVSKRSLKDSLNAPVQHNLTGKGRVAYIRSVAPSIQKPAARAMSGRYWKLPLNWKELIESVNWASGNSLSLNIEAPLSVTMELAEKEDKRALILHLVNFDSKNASVSNIKVDVRVPEGKKIIEVTVMTPDGKNDVVLPFNESGNHAIYTVPQLSVYNMVVMKLK